jgi:hypothetical protein
MTPVRKPCRARIKASIAPAARAGRASANDSVVAEELPAWFRLESLQEKTSMIPECHTTLADAQTLSALSSSSSSIRRNDWLSSRAHFPVKSDAGLRV